MAAEVQARIYYERKHVLLAVASAAERPKSSPSQPGGPPTDYEKQLGSVIGQAFHQGCSLADVALAAELPADRVVAIGKGIFDAPTGLSGSEGGRNETAGSSPRQPRARGCCS
jgi:hypothetical protein